jgi:uncharacterized protein YndB with AHSA1/START domain
MPDILLDFPIRAPAGLDQWWSAKSTGRPAPGEVYALSFGPGYGWRARVTECDPPHRFELELTDADADWRGTRVGVELTAAGETTTVRFHHRHSPDANEHYRISCYCWPMYLRVLRRYLEYGESVPYEQRLDVQAHADRRRDRA